MVRNVGANGIRPLSPARIGGLGGKIQTLGSGGVKSLKVPKILLIKWIKG